MEGKEEEIGSSRLYTVVLMGRSVCLQLEKCLHGQNDECIELITLIRVIMSTEQTGGNSKK